MVDRLIGFSLRRLGRGYTTLEFAVALPVVLTVLFGAIDLTTLVQGYTALREGVRQGVRCVATTDGRCIGVTPAAATPLFHWYRLTSDPTYSADRFDLTGHGYWLRQPTYRYTEARVLDRVHYTVPVTDYAATRWVYPATRALRYNVRETRGAYATGTNPRAPNFVFKNARATPYPSEFIVSHPVNEEISLGRPAVTINTPLSAPVPDAPCYRSTDLDDGPAAAHHPTEIPCAPNRIPAIVYVRGAARGHGHGELTLAIDGHYIANTDFGGQQFDVASGAWQSRNFVPRGVAPGYANPAFSGAPEYALYAEAITVAPGETISVTVSIAPGSGAWSDPAMRYRVTEVRIIPAIVRTVETTVPCPNGIPRGAYLSGATDSCVVPYPAGAVGAINVDTTSNLDHAAPRTVEGIVSPAHLATTLAAHGLDSMDYVVTAGASRDDRRTAACPANTGVPYPPNSGGMITDPGAATVCPVSDPVLATYGIVPQSTAWSERTAPLPEAARFTWTKTDCAHTAELPPTLAAYPKPVREILETDFYPRAPESPLDSRYRCGEFPLHHVVFDETVNGGTVPLPAHSLFLGLHPERELGCLTTALKDDAVMNGGLDTRAYFEIETKRVDAVYLPGAPSDGCAIFRTALGSPGARTLLTPTAPLPYGERPAVCAAAPCVAEFAQMSGGGTAERTADTANAAAYWGYNEVHSLYPRARWGCTGSECVALQIVDGETEVMGRGTLTVPLRTFFGREVTLAFSDRRVKEVSFAQ